MNCLKNSKQGRTPQTTDPPQNAISGSKSKKKDLERIDELFQKQ